MNLCSALVAPSSASLINLLTVTFMSSGEHIPFPTRKTTYSAQSARALQRTVQVATRVPAPSTWHPRGIEMQDMSPSSTLPPCRGQNAPAAANERPSPQGPAYPAANGPSNPSSVADYGSYQSPRQEEHHRLWGVPAYQGHSYGNRSYDYMHKYPPDAEGKELDPDARVWKVYIDESENNDNDMIKSFRDTVDSLLVFAALFSSVVTGFVVETSHALQPDFAKIGASLLFEQNQVLRAAGNVTRIQEIPSSPLTPDSVTHSMLDVAINWMFFTSLALSLATALVAVLIKQWLQSFTALVPGDAKVRSLTRQFRFTGLKKWKLPEIINILPLFLHFALAFFLTGLCVFVSQFHPSILVMVGVVTWAAFAFYVITGILPAVHLDCPYRLPILFIPACFAVYAFKLLWFKISERLQRPSDSPHSAPLSPLRSEEQRHISKFETTKKLEGSSLAWLFNQTTNTSVQRIAIHGVNRFLQAPAFDHFRNHERFRASPLQKALGMNLLKSSQLPLDSMSLAAIRFFKRPGEEVQLEDADILCNMVLSSRQIHGRPLLPASAWPHVLDSPYTKIFLEAEVLPISSESETPLDRFLDMVDGTIRRHNWDAAISLLKSTQEPLLKHRLLDGNTVLHSASTSEGISHDDWVTIFSMTKEERIDFNAFYSLQHPQRTVLHTVSSHGTLPALQHLISHVPNLDVNIVDGIGSRPLHYACDRRRDSPEYVARMLSAVEILLANGADVRQRNWDGKTPLHVLCGFRKGRSPHSQESSVLSVIQRLLSAGSNPNILDNEDRLPLHLACEDAFQSFGDTEAALQVIDELLRATENVNQLSKENFTPLDLLEKSNRRETEEQWKSAHSLMRQHGALLARDLESTRLEQDSHPPPASKKRPRANVRFHRELDQEEGEEKFKSCTGAI